MAKFGERWIRFFTDPIAPDAAFHLSRANLCGIRVSKNEKRVAAHVIRPIPPGAVEPSFDRPNIAEAAAMDAALKDAVRRLGGPDGKVSLLIPETCVKTVLLTFESLPSSPEERESVLRWRLAKTLPLKMSDLRLSFDVARTGSGERAFCVLALESVIREYEQAFSKAGMHVRVVSLPTPHLLGLVPRQEASDVLLVNVEDDAATLLAVGGGDILLFRVKTFAADPVLKAADIWIQVANDVANTIHFLEDREKTKIQSVCVRAVASAEVTAAIEKRVGCPVRAVSFETPAVAGPKERALLAPLIGQVS